VTDKLLLILDLDETLVYASDDPPPTRVDFRVGPYGVMKRPHVHAFLAAVREWFDLAVWTSSSSGYAGVVVENLFPASDALRFLWCSNRCTVRYNAEFGEYYGVKSLRKVKRRGYQLERVLVLDDTPSKHASNYGNLVPIKPFEGEEDDAELLAVLPPRAAARREERADHREAVLADHPARSDVAARGATRSRSKNAEAAKQGQRRRKRRASAPAASASTARPAGSGIGSIS
jgi:RNA polymerase II subunit A small phosphatase-like protein